MAKELPIYQGGQVVGHVLVDGEDWMRLSRYRWQWNPFIRVVQRSFHEPGRKARTIKLHREIVGAQPGDTVRRVNGNVLDFRRSNLAVSRDASE